MAHHVLPSTLAVAIGVSLGLGVYTFQFAKGLSYLSSDPNACANCHIMNDYLWSWEKSSHHTRAVCNDCHTPHNFFGKWLTKAETGWNHSVKFTLQNYPDNLRIRSVNRERLLENCITCHRELVSDIQPAVSAGHTRDLNCIRCHASVGHGPRR